MNAAVITQGLEMQMMTADAIQQIVNIVTLQKSVLVVLWMNVAVGNVLIIIYILTNFFL
jgi:hypothetical protein